MSVRELWPQAAVPAVAKSGQKAIDYILKDAEDDDCQRTGEGEGRRESNDAVDKNIMENAQSLKETNYPIWQKSDFINMFSFHLTLFLLLLVLYLCMTIFLIFKCNQSHSMSALK